MSALRRSFAFRPRPASGRHRLAEAWCGAAGREHVVNLLVGTAWLRARSSRRAWTGAHGLAGSAAWLALNPVERQDYRQHGCLDAEISARGIARRLAWRVQAGDLSRVVERAGGLDAVTAQHVFDGARANDGVAISVVRDTIRYVGMAIANLVAMFDPEIVVLGGEVVAARTCCWSGAPELQRRCRRSRGLHRGLVAR
jgi:glucokinase